MKVSEIKGILEDRGVEDAGKLSEALSEILANRLLTRDYLTDELNRVLNQQFREYLDAMKTVIIETVKKSNEDRRISGVADFATKQDIENAVKDTREDMDKAIKKTLGDDNQVLKNIMTAIETAGNTVSSMENSYLKPIKESTDETKKSIDKINNIDDRTRKTEETINNISSKIMKGFVGRDSLFIIISLACGILGGVLVILIRLIPH
jgi:hypothetical protein